LPPGAKADVCAFTAFWEDPATDKEKFLLSNWLKKEWNHLKIIITII
jgi:hypothetical protein